MSNAIRIVNLSTSPVAIPSFTSIVDPLEDRTDIQKTVNADDLSLAGLSVLGVAALVDGVPLDANVILVNATQVLVVADIVDGERNLVIASGAAGATVVTLPLTTTMASGTEIWVYAANIDNAVSVNDNAADTINGGAGPVVLTSLGAVARLSNDAVSDWTTVV